MLWFDLESGELRSEFTPPSTQGTLHPFSGGRWGDPERPAYTNTSNLARHPTDTGRPVPRDLHRGQRAGYRGLSAISPYGVTRALLMSPLGLCATRRLGAVCTPSTSTAAS